MEQAELFKGGNFGFQFIPLDDVASKVGIPVVVLRFFSAVLAGYPLAFIYLLLPKGNPTLSHLYSTFGGLFISYFCFGTDCAYNIISILASYISFNVIGTGIYNVIFTFVFQMGYMLGAYVVYASDGYDIKWTTPQCMLCLKLIGLAWDCYDGRQKEEKRRPYQQETCYEGTPSFMEIMGFSYFFGSFLAGPLFSFRTYIKFSSDTLIEKDVDRMSRFFASIKQILAGIFAIVIFTTYDPQYPSEYLIKDDFAAKPFFVRITIMMLTYHIHFCKYAAIWMISESICIITGLTYNGRKEDGTPKWDGVRNFRYRQCMLGPFFQDMLEGFNTNTSLWSGKYVFRRLAFLGNKTASHVLTLTFLSLWHGFYVGYAILFGVEFSLIIAERHLCANLRVLSGKTYEELSFPLRLFIRVVGLTYRAYICSFAATAFILLRWRRIKIAHAAVNYYGFIIIVAEYIAIYITGVMAAKKKKLEKEKMEKEKST